MESNLIFFTRERTGFATLVLDFARTDFLAVLYIGLERINWYIFSVIKDIYKLIEFKFVNLLNNPTTNDYRTTLQSNST